MKKTSKTAIFLFLGALVIRIIYLFEMSGSPYFGVPFLDELYHVTEASRIAAGNLIDKQAFFRAPLYIHFLGAIFSLFGRNYFIVRLIQHIIGAGAVVAIYYLTARIFSKKEALVAGILAACYAPMFYFEGEMLDIFLQFLFYPLILIFILRCRESLKFYNTLALGLLFGISAIARPNILLFIPAAMIFLGIRWIRNQNPRYIALHSVFILGGILLPILPVTLHNYLAEKTFVPISAYGGINLYIGNNPEADGYTATTPRRMYVFGEYEDSVEVYSQWQAARALGKDDITGAEASRYWMRQALVWMRQNPCGFIRLLFKKFVIFFGNVEIKNNKNIYFVSRYSHILRFFISVLPFMIVGSVGLTGMGMALSRNKSPGVMLLSLFLIIYVLGVILFFVSARYRAPVMTVLIPFAAYALVSMWEASKGNNNRNLLFGGMATIFILSVFSFIDWYGVRPENYAKDHWSVGNCYLEKGNLEEAERHYRIAISMDPDYAEALNNLGETYYRMGKIRAALGVFRSLVQKRPEYAAGWNNLGVTYEQMNLFHFAEDAYRTCLEIRPEHIRARLNLVETLLKMDKTREAKSQYQRALETAPDDLKNMIISDQRFEGL